MRRGVRHREEAGEHAVEVAEDVGSAGGEDDARLPEPGSRQCILVPVGRCVPEPLAGPPARAQVAADDLVDLVVRDRRVASWFRLGPTVDRVHDEGEGAAWFEQVVDAFGDAFAVGPLERLSERDQLARAEPELGDLFRDRLDPSDAVDPGFPSTTFALVEHVGVRVEPDCLVERTSELDGEDPGPASDIEQTPGAVEPGLVGQRRDELARVRRTAARVVRRAPSIDRRVVRHRPTLRLRDVSARPGQARPAIAVAEASRGRSARRHLERRPSTATVVP